MKERPIQELPDGTLLFPVELAIYPLEALFRVCYQFTDRCYLFLRSASESVIEVNFTAKLKQCDLSAIVGEFANELINQRVRLSIAEETRPIRELLVAQAFAEADLLDRSDQGADYNQDRKGIAK